MTVSGFLDMVARNPYLVVLRIHGDETDRTFTVVRIPDRTKVELTFSEIRTAGPGDMKRKLMGGWLEHWWTRDFL